MVEVLRSRELGMRLCQEVFVLISVTSDLMGEVEWVVHTLPVMEVCSSRKPLGVERPQSVVPAQCFPASLNPELWTMLSVLPLHLTGHDLSAEAQTRRQDSSQV